MTNKEIGTRIKHIREDKKVSQSELAKHLGYSNNSVISKIENGETEIKVELLLKIAGFLDTNINSIINLEDNNELNNKTNILKNILLFKPFKILNRSIFAIYCLLTILLIVSNFLINIKFDALITVAISVFLAVHIITVLIKNKSNYVRINIPIKSDISYGSSFNTEKYNILTKNLIVITTLLIVSNVLYYVFLTTNLDNLSLQYLSVTMLFLGIIIKVIFMKYLKIKSNQNILIILSINYLIELLISSFLMFSIKTTTTLFNVLWVIQLIYFLTYLFVLFAQQYISLKTYSKIE